MRALPMDFGNGPKVFDINDRFMFGPSLLVQSTAHFTGLRSNGVSS
ncbi:hypothetical protein [Asticcacaulis sp.]